MKTNIIIAALMALFFVSHAHGQSERKLGRIDVRETGTANGGKIKKREATIILPETVDAGSVEVRWVGVKKSAKRFVANAPTKIEFDNSPSDAFGQTFNGWLIVVRDQAGNVLAYRAETPGAESFFRAGEAQRVSKK